MKPVTVADWRALVEKQLAGVAFDKALVHTTAEGLRVEPLYTSAAPIVVPVALGRVSLCVSTTAATLAEDLAGGADALWVRDRATLEAALPSKAFLLVDASLADVPGLRDFALTADPLRDDLVALCKRFPGQRTVLVSTVPYHDAGADAADELALALSTGAHALRTLVGARITSSLLRMR